MSETRTLAQAVFAAKMEMRRPAKDATNPHFKSKYANLPSVLDAAEPALAAQGVMVGFDTTRTDDGRCWLLTVLTLAETGEEWRRGAVELLGVTGMQPQGSALTYAQRYSLSLTLALPASEDDDGNLASKVNAGPGIDARKRWMSEHSRQLAEATGMGLDVCKRAALQDFPDWQTCDADRWQQIVTIGAEMIRGAREDGADVQR